MIGLCVITYICVRLCGSQYGVYVMLFKLFMSVLKFKLVFVLDMYIIST